MIVANYKTDKLIEWDHSITMYYKDMKELKKKLRDLVIQDNSPALAQRVRDQLNLLNHSAHKFYYLQIEIQQQYYSLKAGYTHDNSINMGTDKRNLELAHIMEISEKQYKAIKFDCCNFLYRLEACK